VVGHHKRGESPPRCVKQNSSVLPHRCFHLPEGTGRGKKGACRVPGAAVSPQKESSVATGGILLMLPRGKKLWKQKGHLPHPTDIGSPPMGGKLKEILGRATFLGEGEERKARTIRKRLRIGGFPWENRSSAPAPKKKKCKETNQVPTGASLIGRGTNVRA